MMRILWAVLSIAASGWMLEAVLTAPARADLTIVAAAEGGPDFEIQGEYLGKVRHDTEEQTFGAQVVALGQGKFRLVGYQGGLPGAGWSRGGEQVQGEGERSEGTANFKGDFWTGRIEKGTLQVFDGSGTLLGTLVKTERQSPTLGAKPPHGARVLFDGKSAENFQPGELVMGDLLKWGCDSKQKFGDHTLHLEFRTPFMPESREQGRGNSGMYVQGRYEVQILDSFGLEGADNECGGIYRIARPLVNMCFPPLAWQTYDVEFRAARYDDSGKKTENARVTVRHNGVVIHDDLELKEGTPGHFPEGPGPEALHLQDHGNPVVFRNIWAVER